MKTFNQLSISERTMCIESAQLWLRGKRIALRFPLDVDDACRRQLLDLAERAEMDRDWIEDRLSFVRSGGL